MFSWSEVEAKYKLLFIVVACLLGAGAAWYVLIRPIGQANRNDRQALLGKHAEIAQLRPYQTRIAQLTRDVEALRQQIELHRKIVPEEKQVDGFIRGVQAEARSAGIEIRRFSVLPIVAREFYSEAPVELELDGSYFGVVRFYERLAKMDRLVNVSGLQMASVKNPSQAKTKKTYQYAPTRPWWPPALPPRSSIRRSRLLPRLLR